MADRPAAVLAGVYRHDHAAAIRRVLDPLTDEVDIRRWALDRPAPALSDWTRGSGSGMRTTHLNALLADRDDRAEVILCDDDIEFPGTSIRSFLRLARLARLDLAQPAHAAGSHYSHDVTRRRRWSIVRLTAFVEIGPVVYLSAAAAGTLLPMPEVGMGWGLDVMWSDLVRQGHRLGVVDAVPVRHLGAVAADYRTDEEDERLHVLLAERGLADMSAIARTTGAWPPAYGTALAVARRWRHR